jgi:hypothetical protein
LGLLEGLLSSTFIWPAARFPSVAFRNGQMEVYGLPSLIVLKLMLVQLSLMF